MFCFFWLAISGRFRPHLSASIVCVCVCTRLLTILFWLFGIWYWTCNWYLAPDGFHLWTSSSSSQEKRPSKHPLMATSACHCCFNSLRANILNGDNIQVDIWSLFFFAIADVDDGIHQHHHHHHHSHIITIMSDRCWWCLASNFLLLLLFVHLFVCLSLRICSMASCVHK